MNAIKAHILSSIHKDSAYKEMLNDILRFISYKTDSGKFNLEYSFNKYDSNAAPYCYNKLKKLGYSVTSEIKEENNMKYIIFHIKW